MKKRVSRATWRRRVRAWQASGLSISQFAVREGIHVGGLYYWRSRFDAGPHTSSKKKSQAQAEVFVPTEGAFVEVSPIALDPVLDTPFELTLRSGIQLKIPQQFDAEAVERLVSVLEKSA